MNTLNTLETVALSFAVTFIVLQFLLRSGPVRRWKERRDIAAAAADPGIRALTAMRDKLRETAADLTSAPGQKRRVPAGILEQFAVGLLNGGKMVPTVFLPERYRATAQPQPDLEGAAFCHGAAVSAEVTAKITGAAKPVDAPAGQPRGN